MASSNDSAFVEDVDIEREMRARLHTRTNSSSSKHGHAHAPSKKSSASSPVPEADEEAPLLSDAGSSYSGRGSVDSRDGNEEPEWFGYAELRGLPWWKKPSVCCRRHRKLQHEF